MNPLLLVGTTLGLPWTSAAATALVAVLLPLLWLCAPGFLRARGAQVALLLLITARALLALLAPPPQLCVRVYPTPAALAAGQWVRTYATWFAPGCSAVLEEPWTEARQFPIEWMNRAPPPEDQRWLAVQISDRPPQLALHTRGATPLPEPDTFAFSGPRWALAAPGLARPLRWRLADAAAALLLLAHGAFALRQLLRRRALDRGLLCLCALGLLLPRILPPLLGAPPGLGTLPLGAALLLSGALLVADAAQRPERAALRPLGLVVLCALGAPVLGDALARGAAEAGRMAWFAHPGDDWWLYQQRARQIFVEGDPWLRAEPLIASQPLYRYLVGALHVLFGQAPLAQALLDAWAVAGGAALVAALLQGWGAPPWRCLLGAVLLLLPLLGEGFRYHLGRGLQELSAMLLLLLTARAAQRARDTAGSAGAAGALALLAGLLRLDHLPALLGLGLLCRRALPAPAARRWLLRYGAVLALGPLALALRNWHFGGRLVLVAPRYLAQPLRGALRDNLQSLWLAISTNPQRPTLGGALIGAGALAALGSLWGGRRRELPALGLGAAHNRVEPRARPQGATEAGLGPPQGADEDESRGSARLGAAVSLLLALAPYLLYNTASYPPRFSIHLLPLAVLVLGAGRRA